MYGAGGGRADVIAQLHAARFQRIYQNRRLADGLDRFSKFEKKKKKKKRKRPSREEEKPRTISKTGSACEGSDISGKPSASPLFSRISFFVFCIFILILP